MVKYQNPCCRKTDSRGAAFSTSYSYDSLGRLQQAQTNDLTAANTWQLAWTYDRYGNRLTQTLTGGTMAVGQPQLIVDPGSNRISSAGFGYDASGNLKLDPNGSYIFDADNRMTQSVVGGTTAAYGYDGNRLRVQKTVGATTTTYVFSGAKVIAEYSNGALSKESVYSGSRLLATVAAGVVTYHHPDHLSNRLETNSAGTVTRSFGQLPFGDTWYETGTADKWKFTTYERDPESGLDYATERYYSSGYGRFTAADLLPGSLQNPQSVNRYSYVTNDPMNMVDPLGLHLFLVTSSSLCTFSIDGNGRVTDVDCTLVSQNVTDLEPGSDGSGGGGGGGTGNVAHPARHDAFKDKYSRCRNKVFGNATVLPGSNTPVPGEEATLLILGAAYSEEIEGPQLASFVATIGLESGYNLYPTNNGNYRNGKLVSVDFGPGQVNLKSSSISSGNFDTDVFGTNMEPGQKFHGDPYQNLMAAADVFNSKPAPENYVGGGDAAQDRKAALDKLTPRLQDFINCLQK